MRIQETNLQHLTVAQMACVLQFENLLEALPCVLGSWRKCSYEGDGVIRQIKNQRKNQDNKWKMH